MSSVLYSSYRVSDLLSAYQVLYCTSGARPCHPYSCTFKDTKEKQNMPEPPQY